MRKNRPTLPPDIAEVLERIEYWRKTRPGPGRMPEALWSAVVGLVPAHGLNPVARALRLDYYSLKRRFDAAPTRLKARERTPAFVEVALPPVSSPAQCVLELQEPRGGKMTLQMHGPVDVVALAEAFWRRRRCSR